MTQVTPWSVKGVSDAARSMAKLMAQQNGQNIGAWLSEVIIAAASAAKIQANPHAAGNNVEAQNAIDAQSFHELSNLVLTLAKKMSNLETDTVDFAGSFQDQLSALRLRIQALEQEQDSAHTRKVREDV